MTGEVYNGTKLASHYEKEVILQSVTISPIVKLARCVTTEETLEQLAETVASNGSILCGIRLMRPGSNREWKPGEVYTKPTELHEIEAHVEGGQTRLI